MIDQHDDVCFARCFLGSEEERIATCDGGAERGFGEYRYSEYIYSPRVFRKMIQNRILMSIYQNRSLLFVEITYLPFVIICSHVVWFLWDMWVGFKAPDSFFLNFWLFGIFIFYTLTSLKIYSYLYFIYLFILPSSYFKCQYFYFKLFKI